MDARIVVGVDGSNGSQRRGRGGFGKLLLGSTSHHLSHHLDRPLVIVP